MKENNSQIIIYQTESGDTKLDVTFNDETVWLSQIQLCELFDKSKATISEHIKHIFEEGELMEDVVVRKFRTTTQHGAITGKTQSKEVNYYNLDVIISVGYRVKSKQGTQFRIWATQRLKEYIIKGFALNDDRFKTGNSMNYFNELQERIRKIRVSERFFYQKIKDIYTTSIDYNPQNIKDLGKRALFGDDQATVQYIDSVMVGNNIDRVKTDFLVIAGDATGQPIIYKFIKQYQGLMERGEAEGYMEMVKGTPLFQAYENITHPAFIDLRKAAYWEDFV